MIAIDRSRIEPPPIFSSPPFEQLAAELADFHLSGGTRTTQERFDWLDRVSSLVEPLLSKGGTGSREHAIAARKSDPDNVLSALFGLSEYRCFYSEVALDPAAELASVLVLHRPSHDAIGLEGTPSPHHYWWLITEWPNWHLGSPEILSLKGNQFPVAGERMPVPEARPTEVGALDSPLLVDPCLDQPALFLEFRDDGRVYSRAFEGQRHLETYGTLDRGEHTIRMLDLNNDRLAKERFDVVKQARRELFPSGDRRDFEQFCDPTDAGLRFIALRRQLVIDWALEQLVGADRDVVREIAEWAGDRMPVELAATVMSRGAILPAKQLGWIEPAIERLRELVPDAESAPQFAAAFRSGESARRKITDAALVGDDAARGRDTAPRDVDTAAGEAAADDPRLEGEAEAGRGKRERARPPAAARQPPIVFRGAQLVEAYVKNFRAVREATLRFSPEPVRLEPRFDDPHQTPLQASRWKALLGENGSGKSCVLEAIGLALAGGDLHRVLGDAKLTWKQLLRRAPDPADADDRFSQGRIRLEFSGDISIDLRFNDARHWWVGGEPEIQTFVRGYGATRLLDSSDSDLEYLHRHVRVSNLLDPRAAVIDAGKWLLELDEGDFNAAAVMLSGLLGRPARVHGAGPEPESSSRAAATTEPIIRRDGGEVTVDGDPLALVSDGYRAVIAIVCDMIAGLGTGFASIASATGIVLIDEIGAHLHPRWRMAITEKLRRALPNVQFVVSTHEPLCLRGLVGGEVVRLRKTPAHGVLLEEVERSPSDYRVDQLLTSEFFGMDTTIDPDLEARFQAYYRLLSIPDDRRSSEQEEALRTLKTFLHNHSNPVLGSTRRDQLVYEAIDEYLKDADRLGVADRAQRRRETLRRVVDIWEGRRSLSPIFSDES